MLLEAAAPREASLERVALQDAVGRVLGQDVLLDRPEPPVPRSAMDGYALRSADGEAARTVLGTMYAGTAGQPELGPGEAVEVMTGGTVAAGADAVVPVELTQRAGDQLTIDGAPQPGQHVRRAGEMGEAGQIVVPAGLRLDAAACAAIASCGVDPVPVRAQARATVLSTGDEVVAWSETPAPHQVRDANRLATALQLQEAGAQVLATRRVADDPGQLRAAVASALDAGDLVVTIGGVSMGKKDHLPEVFAELGVKKLFHGVAVQPGKPIWVGQQGGKWVVGLPGNPVSSFVMSELIVRPLVARLSGLEPPAALPLQACTVSLPVRTRGRERYFPASVAPQADGLPVVTPDAGRGSGDWTVLASMRALLRVPAHTELEAGSAAHYLPLDARG